VATVSGEELRDGGELSDLAPTVLAVLGLERPAAMTGTSLLARDDR
jgi:2,3-bisphosphoglycerate-independent phosphoglycerate mutase